LNESELEMEGIEMVKKKKMTGSDWVFVLCMAFSLYSVIMIGFEAVVLTVVQIVSENSWLLAFIIGGLTGAAIEMVIIILASAEWGKPEPTLREKVKILREMIERWDVESKQHRDILKKMESAKDRKETQDLVILKEESLVRLRKLQDEGCDKAQDKLDELFEELGYDFDEEEEELLEKMGAKNK
jgi:gas vesicle protein